jgi:hypothetical protein
VAVAFVAVDEAQGQGVHRILSSNQLLGGGRRGNFDADRRPNELTA